MIPKKLKAVGLGVAGLVFLLTFVSCERIEPGNVGIRVNQYGDMKGVQDIPIRTGVVWYSPPFHDIYQYPTYMQTVAWTDDRQGNASGYDQSITFNSKEGAEIRANVGLSFSVIPDKAPLQFVTFRLPVEEVARIHLRQRVQDAFGLEASKFKGVELFGEQKQALLDSVNTRAKGELESLGFKIDKIRFLNAPKASEQIMKSIEQVISATQKAIEAENKVRQVEAEADQKIAEAQGEAQAIKDVATAQADANRQLAESITPELIQYQMIEKWDGVAPLVMGGESPNMFLNVPAKKTANQ